MNTPVGWLFDRIDWLRAPWVTLSDQQVQITRLQITMIEMETRMTSAENAAYTRAAEVVGLIRAEFTSLRSEVTRLADATDGAVADALAADSDADATRLGGLIDELAAVLPAEVPDVVVPDDGQPAELPDPVSDGGGGGEGGMPDTVDPQPDQPA